MREEVAIINHLMKEEKEEEINLVNMRCMEQQLDAYYNKYSKLAQPGDINPSVHETLDDVLKLPERYKRKTNRIYKEKNYGIMTHSNVINTHKEAAEKMKQVEDFKEQKKNERKLKKEMQEKILKIKKEKDEEIKQAKKRGRPKKATIG